MAADPVVAPAEAQNGANGTIKMVKSSRSNGTHGTNGTSDFESPATSPETLAFTESLTMNVAKISILQETAVRMTKLVKTRLGRSSEVVLKDAQTFDKFLDALEELRLRYMPHSGSKWDKVLRWAESFAGYIYMFHETVKGFMLHSDDANRLIWGSCLSLLQMGPTQVSVLTKAFGLFHKLGLSISLFLRQRALVTATAETRRELAHAYSDLVQLTSHVNAHYRVQAYGVQIIEVVDFEAHFADMITAFHQHRERISNSMWSSEFKISRGFSHANIDIRKIRAFLGAQDSVVRKIISNRQSLGETRAEFTCEWFATHLSRFTRSGQNKSLLVTGPTGCGKSVLAGWTVEKIQGSMERNPYDVIHFHVDAEIGSESSSISVIKALLLQTLDRHIGHAGLPLAILKAIKKATSGSTSDDVEEALWQALELTLNKDKLIIVIDGLDHIAGGRSAKVLERLTAAISKPDRSKIKAIVFSRPLSKAAPPLTQHFSISTERTKDDIVSFAKYHLDESSRFRYMDEKDKDAITSKIADKAKGSFLWADLVFQSLKNVTTLAAIMDYLDRVSVDLDKVLERNFGSLDLKRGDTLTVLSWILAAERPLTLREIQLLLEVDVNQVTHSRRFTHIEDDVRHACGSLINIRHGVVFLRHSSIRKRLEQFVARNSTWEVYRKDVHQDMALRCLGYVKIHVHEEIEPSFKRLSMHECHEHFERHELLEYTARYWTLHIASSTMYEPSGNYKLAASFKACFPSSVILSLLESTCLQVACVVKEVEVFQSISYSLRKMILGQQSVAFLQSLIMHVRVCRKTKHTELINFAYEAWHVSKHISHTTLILLCAEAYIEYTKSITFTSRIEITIRTETVLKYIIETHRSIHGASHELTIRYIRILAELYVSIKEIKQATILYHELYLLTVEKHGYFHEETAVIYDTLVTYKFEKILEITRAYHEYVVQTLSVTDVRRVKSTFALVKIYEERGEIVRAEETLVSFWRSVTSTSTSVSSFRETKIDVTLEYSRFLCRHSRQEEAATVMRGLWTEFEYFHEERQETAIIQRIKMIAEEFRSLKITSVARSIYSSLWSYYKKVEETTSTEATEIATSLAETVTETITSTSTSSSSTTTTSEMTTLTKSEESTLREVFESSFSTSSTFSSSTSKTTKISSSTVKTCVALASSYTKQERWSEAVEIYSKTLSQTWSSVESEEPMDLTIEHSHEVIEIAMKLAYCRFQMLQIEKAQAIYWNVLRALIRHTKCDRLLILSTMRTIIDFHEKTYRFEIALDVYREVFVFFQLSLGKKHKTTVELLYAYAALALRLSRRKEAEEAYYEIYIAFVMEDGCLHEEAHKAALALCEFYDSSSRWELSRKVYACLWQTFRMHKSVSFKSEIIERIYKKYTHVLEVTRTEISVIRKVAVEYRKTCIEVYGEHHEITIQATMHLAEISERHEEYREESIQLYEEVLKSSSKSSKSMSTSTTTSSTTTTTTTSTEKSSFFHEVKKRLAKVYSSQTTTISKAISLYQEEYESSVQKYGYSSKETLTCVKNLVQMYKKQSTQGSMTKATTLLKKTTTEIFEKETRSEVIIESARTVAKAYIECGFKETAVTVMHELRRTIIEQIRVSQKTTVESHSYSFFAAFAEILVERSSFSSIMAEIRTEVLLYEAYYRSTRTEKSIVSIIEHAARLRLFLLEAKRTTEIQIVENELFEIFVKHISVSHTVQQTILGQFFSICLHHASEERYDEIIIRLATEAVLEHTNASRFQDAYDLALLIDRYIHISTSGFRTQANILVGFNLAFYLSGRRTKKCGDAKLYERMLELSKIILREALEDTTHADFSFAEMQVERVNELVILLGEQQNYEDLERILTQLWSSRIVQKSWSPTVVVTLGRRLIETRFSRNHTDAAIHLCKDIRYNLTRVWGALDPTTLEFSVLLSELYTATGQHAKAMAVEEELLAQIAFGDEEDLKSVDACSIAIRHLELLQRTYARLGGKFNKETTAYDELLQALREDFKSDKHWKERKVEVDYKKWSKNADSLGTWTKPRDWSFLEKSEVKKLRHTSMLRRTSSNWAIGRDENACGGIKSPKKERKYFLEPFPERVL